MRNFSDTSCREKSKHTFYVQKLLFRKSYRLRDNVENYGTAGLGTDDNMAYLHYMLDT
jgi:hypothetical protein